MTDFDNTAGERLSTVLSDIARVLQAEPDVDTTLAAIVTAAVDHIPGADYAGISLADGRATIRTVAPTDPIVTTIDQAQYHTRQGPCVDSITHHRTYRTGDLAAEMRWPAFTTVVANTGVRSMLSYRLFVTDSTLGSLNLYSRKEDAFSDQTEHDGHLFATHAAIALVGAQTEANLHAAIDTRDVIGMAKGILMQRHNITAQTAFQMLVQSSQDTHLKLRQVATWLVEHRLEQ